MKRTTNLIIMKIKQTSIFSPVFRKKFNAHKYQNYIQVIDVRSLFMSQRNSIQYKIMKFGVNVLIGGMVFMNLTNGQVLHYMMLGKHMNYPSQESHTKNRVPKVERDYYGYMEHEKHFVDQIRDDYGVAGHEHH